MKDSVEAKETLDLTAQSNSNAANWVQFSYGVEAPRSPLSSAWLFGSSVPGTPLIFWGETMSASVAGAIGWHLWLLGEGNWWHCASLQVCSGDCGVLWVDQMADTLKND